MRLFTSLLCIVFFLSYQTVFAQCVIADAGPDKSICSGGSVQIGPALTVAGATYSWSPATGLSNPNIANPIATPFSPITYVLTVTSPDSSCAPSQDTVNVTQPANPFLTLAWVTDGFDVTPIA